jgi:hypothetical protein
MLTVDVVEDEVLVVAVDEVVVEECVVTGGP